MNQPPNSLLNTALSSNRILEQSENFLNSNNNNYNMNPPTPPNSKYLDMDLLKEDCKLTSGKKFKLAIFYTALFYIFINPYTHRFLQNLLGGIVYFVNEYGNLTPTGTIFYSALYFVFCILLIGNIKI